MTLISTINQLSLVTSFYFTVMSCFIVIRSYDQAPNYLSGQVKLTTHVRCDIYNV